MTVKDVLEQVTCNENVTPIWLYNSVGKEHGEFEWGDFVKGKAPQCYLDEEVDHFKQGTNNGPVSIVLK